MKLILADVPREKDEEKFGLRLRAQRPPSGFPLIDSKFTLVVTDSQGKEIGVLGFIYLDAENRQVRMTGAFGGEPVGIVFL